MKNLEATYQKLFRDISLAANTINQQVFVVGGFVRDYYLDRIYPGHHYDIDFVTDGSGIQMANTVAKRLGVKNVTVYRKFGTAQITYHSLVLEFVGARKESYRADSRKPSVEAGTIKEDQLRRDFTINALSWSLNPHDFGELIDPFGGIKDLEERWIRTPVQPEKTFSDDPLRMLRAVRFASQLHFNIAPETRSAMISMAGRMEIVSRERILDELNKIILSDQPSVGFRLLFETGLLEQFFPELVALHGVEEVNNVRHKDNLWHTLRVLDNIAHVSDNLWLRWAALLHDIAKPHTKRFDMKQGWTFHGHDALGAQMVPRLFRRFGLPLDERMRYVKKLVRLHLRPIALVGETVSDSAVRRLIFEAGDDIDDLMTLCRADITSKNHLKIKQFLKNFDHVEKRIAEVEEKDRIRNWRPPVSGNDIMEICGLPPGPLIGDIKDRIEEAILNGDIPNTREDALGYLLSIRKDIDEKNRKSSS